MGNFWTVGPHSVLGLLGAKGGSLDLLEAQSST
jgi:hypothetical protein